MCQVFSYTIWALCFEVILSVYMCVHTLDHTHTSTHINTNTHSYTHTHAHTHPCMHTRTHLNFYWMRFFMVLDTAAMGPLWVTDKLLVVLLHLWTDKIEMLSDYGGLPFVFYLRNTLAVGFSWPSVMNWSASTISLGHGGSLVDSSPFVWRVVGSNPALAAM